MGDGGRGGGAWVGVCDALLSRSTGGSGRAGAFGIISGLMIRLVGSGGGEEDHHSLPRLSACMSRCLESNMLRRLETCPVNFILPDFTVKLADTLGAKLRLPLSFCEETFTVIMETFLTGGLCFIIARQMVGSVFVRFRMSSAEVGMT